MRSSTDPRAGAGRVPLFCLVSCVQRFPHPSCELRQFSLVLIGARVPVVRHQSPCGGGIRRPGCALSESVLKVWGELVRSQCEVGAHSQSRVSAQVSARVSVSQCQWKSVPKSMGVGGSQCSSLSAQVRAQGCHTRLCPCSSPCAARSPLLCPAVTFLYHAETLLSLDGGPFLPQGLD